MKTILRSIENNLNGLIKNNVMIQTYYNLLLKSLAEHYKIDINIIYLNFQKSIKITHITSTTEQIKKI